jgi:hypothetical protein
VFIFKISTFPQNEPYGHKIHRQDTLGSQIKMCGRICHKNQHLLTFDNFGKIGDLPPKFAFYECHFLVHKILGKRQNQDKRQNQL